jgi:dihydrofolate synthase/folylpolyglutamate synthase
MNYKQAIAYLLSFADFERSGRFSTRTDLAPMQHLLHELGDPQLGRLTVHIAGSKGKGSTAAMISSILRECGLKVGTFISPHLHSFRERLQVDGAPIGSEGFASLVSELPPAVARVKEAFPQRELVTFDLLTAMAFMHYSRADLDVQVMETGLGGRLDSTNALEEKEVCVITPIGLEHTNILGDSVEEIAREKAGIITPATTVVMSSQPEAAANVIRQVSCERGARLLETEKTCRVARLRHDLDGQELRLETAGESYELRLPLLGRHQLENAATAVAAVEALGRHGVEVGPEEVRRGIASVRWPGRLEVLGRQPLLLLDGAHSAEAARRLRETLVEDFAFSRCILVVGLSKDKDASAFAGELAALKPSVIAAEAHHPRAAPASEVASAFAALDAPALVLKDVREAVEAARSMAAPDDLICVTGSLFVVAEARAYLLGIEGDGG